jgi:hypothetical protein
MVRVSYYPPNDGAINEWTKDVLGPGTLIDRYGRYNGLYASPTGVPIEMRALPPTNTGEYHQFRVQNPLMVQKYVAAPWLGKWGMVFNINFQTQLKI